jgi:hemolysin activation/secretion protein
LDADSLLKLGGNTGMRGYKNDQFVGNRSIQFNAEDRLFFIDDAFSLVSIGAAAFFDSGTAWPQERAISFSEMNSDIGLGLRFGLTRSSNEVVVRLDFAYCLNRVNSDDAKYVVTFGTGQAF